MFRLLKDRVFYINKQSIQLASIVPQDKLISVGTCMGKFSKTGKFRLTITALDILAPLAKNKVWLKPNSEQQFLYGNHVLKSGLSRVSDETERYEGVIIFSIDNLPLGFGVAAKSSTEIRSADPMSIVIFHQADKGEFVRNEETL
ncbi:Ubiquitin-conjugating enzyme E2 variant 2 [Sarcoptes scabiei]|nr:Ubiquitin-conjugating enzyme E2 variant 2 [Sarcoptes scabiei]